METNFSMNKIMIIVTFVYASLSSLFESYFKLNFQPKNPQIKYAFSLLDYFVYPMP